MQATQQRARPTKRFLIASLCFLAVLVLAACQFGDNNGLNNMPFAKVRRLVSDLPEAQRMANAGNLELLASKPVPGEPVTLRGELTDANCYLGTHARLRPRVLRKILRHRRQPPALHFRSGRSCLCCPDRAKRRVSSRKRSRSHWCSWNRGQRKSPRRARRTNASHRKPAAVIPATAY